MSLLEFLSNELDISNCPHQQIQHIDDKTQEDFSYKNEYSITKVISDYYDEICLQRKIAAESGALILGIEDPSIALANMIPDEPIIMRFIDNPHWSGRIYFTTDKKFIGISLGRKTNPNWKTPPDWDGSTKMLEDFNNKQQQN